MKEIMLGTVLVNQLSKPYIIAEIGVNHGGIMETAKELILSAKRAGANAAKFQTYKAKHLVIKDSPAYWDLSQEKTRTQHELFEKYELLNESDYVELANYCQMVGIDFASTPFDVGAVDSLQELVSYFKVASADITNIPLLERIANTNKPVILSTGAATLIEIQEAILILQKNGAKEIALLHCILNYPTINSNSHLLMMQSLMHEYPNLVVGLSDHSIPDATVPATLIAYAMGARIIEKHFTLDKNLPGNDHYHSMDEDDLRGLIAQIDEVFEKLGSLEIKGPLESEQQARLFARRSIVSKRDIAAGELLTVDNITTKRPGTGIGAEYWHKVLGRRLSKPIKGDNLIPKEFLEDLN